MAKEHTIACGITPVRRVHVRRNDAKHRQNATVFVGSIQIGEVAKYKDKWMAFNLINSRVKPSTYKTATAAVKSLVCTQIASEQRGRR